MTLLPNIECDILYVDPPYNARQYLPNYHVLETIARWDSPEIRGKTGMRKYEKGETSVFCNKGNALRALDKIARQGRFKHLILSYNTEGIMPDGEIVSVLSCVGEVTRLPLKYRRFKSNNNGQKADKKHVHELLYHVTKE